MIDVVRDAALIGLGALVQGGAVVLTLVHGFGLEVKSWPLVIAGAVGLVFGRMAVQAVVGGSRG